MLYATKSNVFMASFSCITYTPSPPEKNASTAVFVLFFPRLPHPRRCIHGRFCLVFPLDYHIDTAHYLHPRQCIHGRFSLYHFFFPGLSHRQCTLSTPQAMYPRPFLPCFSLDYLIDTAHYLHPRQYIHDRFCLVLPWITILTQHTIYAPSNVSTAVFALFFPWITSSTQYTIHTLAMYPRPFFFVSLVFSLGYHIDTAHYLHPRQCIHGRFCLCLLSRLHV